MAARILPFRSLAPLPASAKPVIVFTAPEPAPRNARQPASPKVLPMSAHSRKKHLASVTEERGNLFTKMDGELAKGYLEVDLAGLTLRQLALAHAALLRGAWVYTLESVRSLLRPTEAV